MAKLEDDSPMPFGKHKGKAMEDVPAEYLLYLHEKGLKDGNVKDYIEDNMDVLIEEKKRTSVYEDPEPDFI